VGMRAPWLSVVMPSLRAERWIDASLASLAAQQMDGIEILIIDGSPTSVTLDIARSYENRLHLRLFERPDLESWQAKTNFGVEAAAAEHVCWLGSDDVWLPKRAGSARAWIESASDAGLHLAPSAIIDRRGRKIGDWRCPLPEGFVASELVLARLLVQNFVAAPAPVFRKDAWLGCGGLDQQLWYTADWDMWLKLASSGKVVHHDEVTIGLRIRGDSLTVAGSRDSAEFASQMRIVLDRHLARLGEAAKQVEPAARASIAVNAALAAASAGDFRRLIPAALALLRLGPGGIHRYWRDSRIVERTAPRVRARLRGAL
jgi:glycosyltransferase involved in cell wall biosynthesis